ncbi:MAG: P-type transfer ATPase VirB11 [Pseudomonadota bacterium]|jgi:type IV secretion system protein VirB11
MFDVTTNNTDETFLNYQYHVLGVADILLDSEVTEICINRPGHVFIEKKSKWEKIEVPSLTLDRARQFCTALVNESGTGQSISNTHPIVSFTFTTGQRAQFVIPPACEAGSISITIRQPSKRLYTLENYVDSGLFKKIETDQSGISEADLDLSRLKQSNNFAEFFSKAVLYRKNIVVAGATGSGKTTFMKSLVNHIPHHERLVTIEDARELFLQQPNTVHLLYSKGAQSIAKVTSKDCMEACLRMKPDRILLAELRGDEAFFFVRNCASGHPGSITSCHAGSVTQAWDQMALMIKASNEGSALEFSTIKTLLRQTVDIIVHMHCHNGKRELTGIDFVQEILNA